MSNREMIARMLDELPESRLGYVLAFIQGMLVPSDAEEKDDAFDDAFCQSLLQSYLNDGDPEKNTAFSLDDCKKEWGLI